MYYGFAYHRCDSDAPNPACACYVLSQFRGVEMARNRPWRVLQASVEVIRDRDTCLVR
jgi:hypothetical protein